MAISEDLFRDVFRRWPSGAAVVTALADGQPHGMVVGSLCSLSSAPPLLMFSAGTHTRTHAVVAAAGAFAVSILADEQVTLFERFAGFDRQHDDDRFAGLATATAITGAPYFLDGLAWADCRVVDRHPGATYTIFVGELVAAGLGAGAEGSPLIYFRRQRRQLVGVGGSGLGARLRVGIERDAWARGAGDCAATGGLPPVIRSVRRQPARLGTAARVGGLGGAHRHPKARLQSPALGVMNHPPPRPQPPTPSP